ncbi:MAG: hypothetical protein P0Y53_12000 [Candidatus Pseudobacter hemicellulosilyticus]|uniref:Uncharacterized protein n=1 Tax=Candidatus Pseudobacter hemicellulosilyticus TaxID=3121375 RepID=A0AAJ5X174_9BACT|nr:MAG: hypothetical protein P0Y53_12000 [Pseudobacter sp.]
MKFDELQSAWNAAETPVRSANDIQTMLSENKHPVLKSIRRQLTMELMGWSLFLLLYYSMLDGDQKPLWLNGILIFSVLMPLLHNMMGYSAVRYVVHGPTIRASLERYLSRVRLYATVSIVSRLLLMVGLLLFFVVGVSLNEKKYLLLGGIVVIFMVQLWLLYKLWMARLRKLKKGITALAG